MFSWRRAVTILLVLIAVLLLAAPAVGDTVAEHSPERHEYAVREVTFNQSDGFSYGPPVELANGDSADADPLEPDRLCHGQVSRTCILERQLLKSGPIEGGQWTDEWVRSSHHLVDRDAVLYHNHTFYERTVREAPNGTGSLALAEIPPIEALQKVSWDVDRLSHPEGVRKAIDEGSATVSGQVTGPHEQSVVGEFVRTADGEYYVLYWMGERPIEPPLSKSVILPLRIVAGFGLFGFISYRLLR